MPETDTKRLRAIGHTLRPLDAVRSCSILNGAAHLFSSSWRIITTLALLAAGCDDTRITTLDPHTTDKPGTAVDTALENRKEAWYTKHWCASEGGVAEYRLPDNVRVDCLTDTQAQELDWPGKWGECVGQALYYANQTNKIPVCILIYPKWFMTKEAFIRYHKRAVRAGEPAGVRVRCIDQHAKEFEC